MPHDKPAKLAEELWRSVKISFKKWDFRCEMTILRACVFVTFAWEISFTKWVFTGDLTSQTSGNLLCCGLEIAILKMGFST